MCCPQKIYAMDTQKQQMEILHNMCRKELNELQLSMERYLRDSEHIQKILNGRSAALTDGAPLTGRSSVNNIYALISFDRYMSQMSTVVSMARKFNIHLQLNALHKTVLDSTETFESPTMGMNNAQSHMSQQRFLQDFIQWSNSCVDYHKDSPISSRNLESSDGLYLERKAIEQPINAKAKIKSAIKIKGKSEHAVRFKFSDLDTFLRSILPVKELSHFTESHIFSASITYVGDYTNLVFFVCEMNDYGKLFEISKSPNKPLINQSTLSHVVFGISQEKSDSESDRKCVLRAIKLPEELDETGDSAVLIDFGEIIQLTEHCQLYSISPNLQEYPPLAIKCLLKGVCETDGIVTSDHGKCKEALVSNEFKIAKFRVVNQESRVLHLVIIMEAKKSSEEKSLTSVLNITPKTNPFIDSLQLEEDVESEEIGDTLYLPISSVYGTTPRVGPNSKITAKIGDYLQVTVTHVNSPISFYATIENIFEEICEVLFWNDDELKPMQIELSPPELNDIVLAKYSKDDHWYRAQIIEVIAKDKQFKVFYIDFGNTEIVTLNSLTSCKCDLLSRPSQAVPFRLANLKLLQVSDPLIKSWSSAETCSLSDQNLRKATEYVVVAILNQTMTVEVVDRRGDELLVRFIDDLYANIPSMLMNMGVVAKA